MNTMLEVYIVGYISNSFFLYFYLICLALCESAEVCIVYGGQRWFC